MTPDKVSLLIALIAGMAIFLSEPAIIALPRQRPERRLIYKLSPLTTFSFILWFVLMAWAIPGRADYAVISRYGAKLRHNNRLPLVIALVITAGLAGSLVAFMA